MFTADDISCYTREQAIEDGVLVDVSDMAREAGFRFPVALTVGVHALLTPPAKSCEDYKGRLWDVLNVIRFTGRGRPDFWFVVKMGRKNERLHFVCGPGDSGEPVCTILLPGED